MIGINQKKQDDNKKVVGYAAAGVAGAAVIAGVAVAATMALKNEATRKKVTKVLINAKNQVMDYVDALEVQTIETTPIKKQKKKNILQKS